LQPGAGNLNAGSIAFTNGGAASAARHQQFQLELLLFEFNANRKYW
jgi:hypothetical protein